MRVRPRGRCGAGGRAARLAAALFLVVLVVLRTTAAGGFTIIVTENEIPLVPNSVLQLAKELGYYERAGVQVDFVHANGTPLAVAALLAGEGDMANITIDALVAMWRQKQTGYRAVSAPAKPIPYVLVANSAITSVKGLAGKTFGIGQSGTLDATLSERVLAAEGVAKAVDMVSIGPPVARVKALVNGRIDATTISIGTWAMTPEKYGLNILVDRDRFDAIAPLISKVNVVSLDTLRRNREEIVRVTTALMQLSRDFSRAPRSWSDALSGSNPNVSQAELARLADRYRDDWCADDCLDRGDLVSSIRLLGFTVADVNSIADFSIVGEARHRLTRSR
jgi:NitT/TauT family transport system substrate-binding protein